jgi:hypothetical protein
MPGLRTMFNNNLLQLVMEKARRSGADPQSLVDDSDVVELQNGCACCSASDELLMVLALRFIPNRLFSR